MIRHNSETATSRQSGFAVVLMALLWMAVTTAALAAPSDIVLVLDNSGSMRKNDPEYLLKRAVTGFVNELEQSTHVGIVIFDQSVRYPVPIGELNVDSRAAIDEAIDAIDYRGQLTDSPAAIERAIYELKGSGRDDAQKVIVFMTDGIVDTGDVDADKEKTKWLREDLSADAADSAIRMFGIAFTENADFFLIQSLAKKTDGEYFRALTPEDLGGVFENVHAKLAEPVAVKATPTPGPAPTPAATPEATTAAPAASPVAAGDRSCLDGLVPEEMAFMMEVAEAEGVDAESMCREMMQAEPGTAVVVRPDEQTSPSISAPAAPDEAGGGISIMLIALAAGVLLLLVIIVMLVLKRRGGGTAPAAAGTDAIPIPEAFIKDINGIVGEPVTQIGAKPLVFGRVLGSDPDHLDYFVIDQGTVGRRHAIVQYRDFSFWLIDQGSVNGTFLNGERIEGERQLKHGDRIKLHKYEFEFSMPEMDDGGHTVFADPADATIVAEATIIAGAAELTGAQAAAPPPPPPPAGEADVFADDEGDVTFEAPIDEVFDEGATAVNMQAAEDLSPPAAEPPPAEVDEEPSAIVAAMEQPQSDEEFDAEASAFFDEHQLGQTSAPSFDEGFDEPAAPADIPEPDMADDAPTVNRIEEDDFADDPTVNRIPGDDSGLGDSPDGDANNSLDDGFDEFTESETVLPTDLNPDAKAEGTNISLDDFMETETFSTPFNPTDSDDEDATLMPDMVPADPPSAPVIDDVFDITGEGTIEPIAPADDDDQDDDDGSESPTEFRR